MMPRKDYKSQLDIEWNSEILFRIGSMDKYTADFRINYCVVDNAVKVFNASPFGDEIEDFLRYLNPIIIIKFP